MPTESDTHYDPSLGNKFIFVTGGVIGARQGDHGREHRPAPQKRRVRRHRSEDRSVSERRRGDDEPYQHGEVYVLEDGGEVDLDLGNYERFLDIDMTSDHNITTGKTYQHVIEKERAGDYLGKTVQIIPHITDDIKRRIREAAEGTDVCLIEVGGTVGDIEGMPHLEALRQFAHEEPEENVLFTHVTLVPYSKNSEQKTKPTQHSVKEVRSIGLQPDVIVGRCEDRLDPETKEKIALFCDIPTDAVFSNPDVEDVYHVPLMVEDEGSTSTSSSTSVSPMRPPGGQRTNEWRDIVTTEKDGEIDIALVGKSTISRTPTCRSTSR